MNMININFKLNLKLIVIIYLIGILVAFIIWLYCKIKLYKNYKRKYENFKKGYKLFLNKDIFYILSSWVVFFSAINSFLRFIKYKIKKRR